MVQHILQAKTSVRQQQYLSDEPVTITGFDLFRITADGKIAELWQQFNVGSWGSNTPTPFFMNACNRIMRSLHNDKTSKLI
jgi:hypothetical protein